jgi:hypothetical protein
LCRINFEISTSFEVNVSTTSSQQAACGDKLICFGIYIDGRGVCLVELDCATGAGADATGVEYKWLSWRQAVNGYVFAFEVEV